MINRIRRFAVMSISQRRIIVCTTIGSFRRRSSYEIRDRPAMDNGLGLEAADNFKGLREKMVIGAEVRQGGCTTDATAVIIRTGLDGIIQSGNVEAQTLCGVLENRSIFDVFPGLSRAALAGLAHLQSLQVTEPYGSRDISLVILKDTGSQSLYFLGHTSPVPGTAAQRSTVPSPLTVNDDPSLGKNTDVREYVARLLQQTADRYLAMINTVPALMYLKDSQSRYVEINEAFCQFAGKSKGQIVGRTDYDIFARDLAEKYIAIDRQVLTTGREIINQEEKYTASDGTLRWVSTTKVPLRGANGWIDGVVGLTQDVTEQHRHQTQLMQSEKLAGIGTLAAGVAHEINNPIGYINSNLNTMKRYLEKVHAYLQGLAHPNLQQQAAIGEIMADFDDAIDESIEGTGRVKSIVVDLKSFSRVDRAEKEYANLNEGIESTLNVVWNELKYKCKVNKEFGKLPELFCMPNQLNQVFMNILVNAGHAITGDSGIIRINTCADEHNIHVSIRDNGCGIPEEHLKRIFEPFFTTKDVGKGTGLGLSLSHDIIKKHKGTLEVKSKVGEGTEFVITLPLDGMKDG
jgi:PAS domain S-box-containing protein